MAAEPKQIPPGPVAKYDTAQDLLSWMGEHLRQFGDIYKASVFGASVYVVAAPEYAEHVLRKNWQNYVKGQAIKRVALLLGNGLMVSEGESWKSQRRMIQPAFHRDAMATLIDVVTSANIALRQKWEQAALANASVNVTRDLSLMVLQVVLVAIFGEDYAAAAPHFSMLSGEPTRDLRFAQAFRSLGKIVMQVVARRRKEAIKHGDILGLLLEARDRDSGQAMPDRQLVNEIMTLIVAGHETTASSLNWLWYLLSQHPAVEEKLSHELDGFRADEPLKLDDLPRFSYTRQVIDEALRLYPPGWLMTRKALADDHLGDYFVPAGTEIYISPYFIQRNPALWEAPERFDPDRFGPDRPQDRHPLAMLPFSAGPRNCIGEAFARIEIQIHLMIVAKRLRLRSAETKPPELEADVNLRSRYDFVMTPEIKPSVER
jgi:cytochrome P450